MDRPAILCVNHTGEMSGAEFVHIRFLKRLPRNHMVLIGACPDNSPMAEQYKNLVDHYYPIPAIRFPGLGAKNSEFISDFLSTCKAMNTILKKHKVCLLHANTFKAHLACMLPSKWRRVPNIWHMHDILKNRARNKAVVRLASRMAHRILTPSNATAESLIHLGAHKQKVHTLYNGIPFDEFEEKLEHDQEAASLLAGEGPKITMVGLITPWKGQDIFIEAASLIAQKFPSARFFLVGGCMVEEDRVFLDNLTVRTKELNLSDCIVFTGFRKDVLAIMKHSDVIVHASRHPDPLPTVILEAMALGKPVIGSHLGGVSEMILHGETGFVYKPENRLELAQYSMRILHDPDLAKSLGQKARDRILKKFTLEKSIKDLLDHYNQLITVETPQLYPAARKEKSA